MVDAAFVSFASPSPFALTHHSFRCRPRTYYLAPKEKKFCVASAAGAPGWRRSREENRGDNASSSDAAGDLNQAGAASGKAAPDGGTDTDIDMDGDDVRNPAALQVPDGSWTENANVSVPIPRKLRRRRRPSYKFVVPPKRGVWDKVREISVLGLLFGAWYASNAAFNVYNKRVLAVFPYPLTATVTQFAVGAVVMGSLWMTKTKKAPPFLSKYLLRAVVPLSICHAAGFLLTNMALGKVSVAFTHTVKATEPFFAAALTPAILGDVPTWGVVGSLVPIVGGVALASATESSFNWIGFLCAVGSNVALQSRNILSKRLMSHKAKEESEKKILLRSELAPAQRKEEQEALDSLDNINLFATMTVVALVVLFPVSTLWEGLPLFSAAAATANTGMPVYKLWTMLSIGGACRCIDVLTSYMILQRVSPVTHSIGNCVKRAVVISVSIALFNTPMTFLTAVGTCVALAGVLLYSVVVAGCKHNTFGRDSPMCKPIYKKELELTGGGGI